MSRYFLHCNINKLYCFAKSHCEIFLASDREMHGCSGEYRSVRYAVSTAVALGYCTKLPGGSNCVKDLKFL
jgi:hypothetical protein